MNDVSIPPMVGLAAFSGTGKTTLLLQLIPLLTGTGLKLAVVKHAHHSFDVDEPGKDSFEIRKAGAAQTLVASQRRWALMTEHSQPREPQLQELVQQLDTSHLDLIVVEGFKQEHFPKIELRRKGLDHPPLYTRDPSVIALATDEGDVRLQRPLPLLDINQPAQIAHFILKTFFPHRAELREQLRHGLERS